MSLTMEIMIMVALMMFVLTNVVSIVITVWYIKIFHPMVKPMMNTYKRMLEEMEDEA